MVYPVEETSKVQKLDCNVDMAPPSSAPISHIPENLYWTPRVVTTELEDVKLMLKMTELVLTSERSGSL